MLYPRNTPHTILLQVTEFTEAEVWDIGHHGARLRVTDVTGNGVDTDANGNSIPISYECNMVKTAAHISRRSH